MRRSFLRSVEIWDMGYRESRFDLDGAGSPISTRVRRTIQRYLYGTYRAYLYGAQSALCQLPRPSS